jgi:hypothetical protein
MAHVSNLVGIAGGQGEQGGEGDRDEGGNGVPGDECKNGVPGRQGVLRRTILISSLELLVSLELRY